MNLWIYIYTILCYHIPCIQPRFKPSRWTHWKVKQLSCPAYVRPWVRGKESSVTWGGHGVTLSLDLYLVVSLLLLEYHHHHHQHQKKWKSAIILILTDFIDDIHEYTTILCGICWLSHSAPNRSLRRSPLESGYQSVFHTSRWKTMINKWIVQCCSPSGLSEKKSYQYIPIAS
jgi:hypothetical protein